MTKNQKTILLAVIGAVLMLIVVVVGVGVWAVRSMVDNANMDQATATRTMDDVRARFAHAMPVMELQPGGLTLSRRPPDTKPPGELKTLHILRWSVRDGRLARVELPFWLLRMRDSPIDVVYQGEPGSSGLSVRTPSRVHMSDLERFGSALLIDGDMPDGGHLLIWSD